MRRPDRPTKSAFASTFSDVAQGHRDLIRESMDALLQGNARLLRIAGKIAEDAARPIEDRTRR